MEFENIENNIASIKIFRSPNFGGIGVFTSSQNVKRKCEVVKPDPSIFH